MLSDPRSEIIRAFDVLNREIPQGGPGYGIARPIIFVIDPKGIVRHRFSEERYTERPAIDGILKTLGGRAGG